ncbi:large neutral amino acids transporter small subunit 2 [Ischnura elegans]|uniref:large neutral amino acids transporter small subunit 2 n=1 Tax=Ischnura elegans TaxID=197161 RepID=UPI001ED89933|nr:large neutral amino acids transporter small subunit 2 [Ischnura elegans]XP_046393095.1 large neutral amino acids transporter small subunit 2 [Ischnura elegans]XP_046393103.1 large neutral amino acids transporter small subunit 2 [Ischnura elegans]XP_046393112.1 large neutral amino acids transporter small subunit 2 [Ischnura elegans]
MGRTSLETDLMSPDRTNDDGPVEKVKLKKELGLLEGVAIILGIIFGSGIFISPKGVIQEVGSVGFSLIVWVLCGMLSTIGALCYAELGTSVPKSGGDYAYIHEAFGSLPSFLFLWAANLIFIPTTNAIMGLTFASYVIQPFFPNCVLPDDATRIIAALAISFLTFVNCYDVRITTKMQDVFMFGKVAALVIIILAGFAYLFVEPSGKFDGIFDGTTTDPGKIAVSFYSGIFSYAGWNYLNFMTEELRDPYKNLPRAIYISLPLVTIIYVLANVAYLAVLTPTEMIASNAIAVTFGDRVLGVMSWIMPLFVAMSAFGGLSVHIMTSSRLCFVGARQGQFPIMLSFINVKRLTPTPSLVFLNILSLMMLSTSDIYVLITYCSIVESLFIALSVGGLIWMRWKNPKMIRPIKISIVLPCIFVLVCIFLIALPIYVRPFEVAMGLTITLSGIPFYFASVLWKNRPSWYLKSVENVTSSVQKLFLSAKED